MTRRLPALAFAVVSALAAPAALAQAARVELTWMSIANWDMKIGDKRLMMDAYISRLPEASFYPPPNIPKDLYAYTKGPQGIDVDSIRKVREAELGADKLDYLLVGHSHWDHSWDSPTWAKLTGAQMIGGNSSCLQAVAQGVPAAQCRTVNGGEKIALGEGITMRVVRFNHSGDTSNPIQHFPRELYRPPVPDPATGGFRAGVGEDYPNGGGNRAFLFTVDRGGEQLSFFINNSSSAFDLDKDIIIDGVNYGSPLNNLRAAMKDAGLSQVDAWIGTGGKPVAELVVPVIHPKTYIPNHWDGLFNAFWPGLPYPFKDNDLQAYLQAQNIALAPQKQYFDKYVLTKAGVQMDANLAVKQKLGFAPVQKFSRAVMDAVALVPSTRIGEDCGEGFEAPSAWANALALLRGGPASREPAALP
jgi:L-ascorbate metabolism protein UlaG (beta-lactamase superfamily)